MCGIVGSVSSSDSGVITALFEGLMRLEYRGYDSVGMAGIDFQGNLWRKREVGGAKELEYAIKNVPNKTHIGIAHARWATHGGACIENAHPHFSGDEVAIVHNGIIENYGSLRNEMESKGYIFASETDSEVIAHIVDFHLSAGLCLYEAVKEAVSAFDGTYAIGVISVDDPDRMIAARRGSPLIIGYGQEANYIASDIYALSGKADRYTILDDGDIAEISSNAVTIYDEFGSKVERAVKVNALIGSVPGLGDYDSWMYKEIMEQPSAIERTIGSAITQVNEIIDKIISIKDGLNGVQIVACGTSYNAGVIAQKWFEGIAKIRCDVEYASEYTYRSDYGCHQKILIAISQSGETADTLSAVNHASKASYLSSIALCNVRDSSITRLCQYSLFTEAGHEIGVASTKAFTTQLVVLLLLALGIAKRKSLVGHRLYSEYESSVRTLPELVRGALAREPKIVRWARDISDNQKLIYIGREILYPVAMEGALKMKELTYMPAQGYPSGELKHGPLALVDDSMNVVALISGNEELRSRQSAAIAEIKARDGQVYVISDEVDNKMENDERFIVIPCASTILSPIVLTIPLQLLAYHVAMMRNLDVDKPRNLAKSVTVE